MARKYRYFNVYITKGNQITDLSFNDLLIRIMTTVVWNNRLRNIKNTPMAMFQLNIPDEDDNIITFNIGKYRNNSKPYVGDYLTPTAQLINGNVIEMTAILSDVQSRLLLIEYNYHGATIKELEEYFSSFLNNENENEKCRVIILPIKTNIGIQNIRASNNILGIDLKFNVGSDNFMTLLNMEEEVPVENRSMFGKIVNVVHEIKEVTEAPIVSITLSKGRRRNLMLSTDQILDLIELLDLENNSSVESCKVRFKDNVREKTIEIDLKDLGVRSDIAIDGDSGNYSWELVVEKMLEQFLERRPATNEHNNRGFNLVEAILPQILIEPAERHKVVIEDDTRAEVI